MSRLGNRPSAVALIGSLCLGVAALAGFSCGVGDAVCTDHTVEEDRNDECPYGPPGGPQRKPVASEGCKNVFSDEDCTVSFGDDVFPILVASYTGTASGGGCTLPACHGPTGTGASKMVVAEAATPQQLYDAMAASKNENLVPYVAEDDEDAYFLCNLKGTIGGGSAMPPNAGLTDDPATAEDDDHMDIMEEWVRCGMKFDAGSGEGGGGIGGAGTGGGGIGGAGGAALVGGANGM